jgi:hypothetical protein
VGAHTAELVVLVDVWGGSERRAHVNRRGDARLAHRHGEVAFAVLHPGRVHRTVQLKPHAIQRPLCVHLGDAIHDPALHLRVGRGLDGAPRHRGAAAHAAEIDVVEATIQGWLHIHMARGVGQVAPIYRQRRNSHRTHARLRSTCVSARSKRWPAPALR